ncbi:hypothetical protein VZC37_15010 [Gordonia sp. LSe1-13]|uniref:Uncharacterized protein n=1 Tax=Gordonia sesuvii TaxID=3116777 RepID=A0ABU7MEV4_9ACTN|nr:hypothetical protein [Gordonia sp. LSe1-13]
MDASSEFADAPPWTDNSVPWGRPIVDDIPVPPFTDRADRERYLRMLRLHLAMIDDGGPSRSTVIVNSVLTGTDSAFLGAAEFRASMLSFFPAPWTPTTLAAQIAQVERRYPPRSVDGNWLWLGDPDFTATPLDDGGWGITQHERGTVDRNRLTRHGDLVLLWMSHFVNRFPFPYGWAVPPEETEALAPAARRVRELFNRNREARYLKNWRDRQDRALSGEADPSGRAGEPE